MQTTRIQLLQLGKATKIFNLPQKLSTTTVNLCLTHKREIHIQIYKPKNWIHSFASLRYASSEAVLLENETDSTSKEPIEELPIEKLIELPNTPPPLEEITTEVFNTIVEPSFAAIGLGGWSPVGIIQNSLEYLHVSCDIPWCGAIAIGTIIVRTLMFPLVIMAQRNAAKMNNNMPQLQVLQMKMTEARQSGNAMDSARYAQEILIFMKDKKMNPLKNIVVPLAQTPLFISFFMGLRAMTNAPVESMREGGIFWFTDLTACDPTFILPLVTSATLYLTIEIGTDSARLSAQNMMKMKYLLRALPVLIFPFTMNFPAAILTYWACSNFISLAQVTFLKIPSVREYFKIEKMNTHIPENLTIKPKSFFKSMKDSWQNIKISREMEERQHLDEMKISKGQIMKTFKSDSTKSNSNSIPMETKGK